MNAKGNKDLIAMAQSRANAQSTPIGRVLPALRDWVRLAAVEKEFETSGVEVGGINRDIDGSEGITEGAGGTVGQGQREYEGSYRQFGD